MAIITADDIYRRVRREIVDEVTRYEGDPEAENPAVTAGINSAIKEVKMYLSRFDLVKLFGTDSIAAIVDDPFLKDLCIDIAVYRIMCVASSGLDYEIAMSRYKASINTLKSIQTGACMPEGWPYLDTTGETAPNGDSISWSSNPKRINHF